MDTRPAIVAAALSVAGAWPADAGTAAVEKLALAYPEAIERVDGGVLVWRDGTRMPVDDGAGEKSLDARLDHPDIKDMLVQPYPAGEPLVPPAPGEEPGRARNTDFFAKLYGDCTRGETSMNLVDVVWLPMKYGKRLKFNARHGAARHLAAVSARLDALPARFDVFLSPPAGTYTCRPIAGTRRVSAHGWGIAIDIAVARAHYWRWPRAGKTGYHNEIPAEIVAAFEAEGFIWGGRWDHFDTMHFEYRPELARPVEP